MNLLTRLRLGEGLSAGERALAEVLLADLDAFLADGTKQLAARAHVFAALRARRALRALLRRGL
ncbi:hypothetical protein [Thermophilibacter mediterraneus]|uniref:hypothetical protein n=1 Tax=Thermophilibacter mediterraneus TaxID=1871031 RepID=UPI00320A5A7B